MLLSRRQLSAALKRKCLDLNEKVAILDYTNEYSKMGCRKLAEHFSVVFSTFISNNLKDSKNLRRDYEYFKGRFKKRRHEKCHGINEFLYK